MFILPNKYLLFAFQILVHFNDTTKRLLKACIHKERKAWTKNVSVALNLGLLSFDCSLQTFRTLSQLFGRAHNTHQDLIHIKHIYC